MTKYRYRFLPRGNSREFPELDAYMLAKGIQFEYHDYRYGGRMYRVPVEELSKFPSDEEGPYFGTDEDGYSFHNENIDIDRWLFGDETWNWKKP